jgi:hypothetical protein
MISEAGIDSASASSQMLVGVDFAGPKQARQQRRKIIAIAALPLGERRYRVSAQGINERLLTNPLQPGWTAEELARVLVDVYPARIVACDFPFSIPEALIVSPEFAAAIGVDQPFGTWQAFNRFVAGRLPMVPPVDLSPFAPWRDKRYWLLRATDLPARAQPALKDRFQVLFNMTLLGNAFIAALAASGAYSVVPFEDTVAPGEIIEIYPGLTMRALGRPDYKRDPSRAIDCVLARCFHCGVVVEIDPDIRAFCESYRTGRGKLSDPDGSDALIALATAILYSEGQCAALCGAGERRQLQREGVIWGPKPVSGATTLAVET